MNRMTGIILAVLGVVAIVVAYVVFNGVGGGGHYKADASAALGVVLVLVGLFAMMRKQAA